MSKIIIDDNFFDERDNLSHQGYPYSVNVLWGIDNWNEVCADVMEVFGLPGDRWEYHASFDDMCFMFKSKKDYTLCTMLLSDKL